VGFAVVGLLAGCGDSQRNAFVCPASEGHSVVQPFNGRLVALGRPPIYVRIDNRGDLRRGVVALGLTDFPGWFAVKTHFFSVRGYDGPVRVHVKRIDRRGAARLGNAPTDGSTFSAPTVGDQPVFTWMRAPGCYRWSISSRGFHETVVIRATAHE